MLWNILLSNLAVQVYVSLIRDLNYPLLFFMFLLPPRTRDPETEEDPAALYSVVNKTVESLVHQFFISRQAIPVISPLMAKSVGAPLWSMLKQLNPPQ